MTVPFSYYDLIEAFAEPECAVCRLVLRDVDRYLDALLYEFATDPATQASVRASRGMCNQHAWRLRRYKSGVLGTAIFQAAALDEVLHAVEHNPIEPRFDLGRLFGESSVSAGLVKQLEPEALCLACTAQASSERLYVETLAKSISDARLQDAYRHSVGLCLPHFRAVLRRTRDAALLVALQTDIWRSLKHELDEFIRKNDFQHADEPMGAEGNSWLRAIARLSGEDGVFGVQLPTP